MFCTKLTPLYTAQNTDLFNKYKDGLSKHTDKRYPIQLPEDEQYDRLSTQLNSCKVLHTEMKSSLLF